MNLSARSLFGLWTWHISIQYSRITVLAYKTSHFFFYGFVLHFEIRTEFPMCFSVFFRPVIGTKTSRLKSTEKNRTDRKMTMEKWTPRKPNHSSDRWHRTTLFWEKHMKHPPPFFLKSTPNNFTVFYIQNLYTVLWGTNAVWWRKAALLASLRLLLSLYDICTFFCYHKWCLFCWSKCVQDGDM